MRLFNSILMVGALLFATTAANALTFNTSVVGATTGILTNDQFTVNITVSLDGADSINNLGASIYGYDTSVIQFVSGDAVAELFFQTQGTPELVAPFCASFPALCAAVPAADGIVNVNGGALAESGGATGNVKFVSAISLDQFIAQAFADEGLDGTEGSVQFSAIFQAVGAGGTDAIVGIGVDLDGVATGGNGPVATNNSGFSVTVVPEPGTALLMGLGLAGLGLAGRREA